MDTAELLAAIRAKSGDPDAWCEPNGTPYAPADEEEAAHWFAVYAKLPGWESIPFTMLNGDKPFRQEETQLSTGATEREALERAIVFLDGACK